MVAAARAALDGREREILKRKMNIARGGQSEIAGATEEKSAKRYARMVIMFKRKLTQFISFVKRGERPWQTGERNCDGRRKKFETPNSKCMRRCIRG